MKSCDERRSIKVQPTVEYRSTLLACVIQDEQIPSFPIFFSAKILPSILLPSNVYRASLYIWLLFRENNISFWKLFRSIVTNRGNNNTFDDIIRYIQCWIFLEKYRWITLTIFNRLNLKYVILVYKWFQYLIRRFTWRI